MIRLAAPCRRTSSLSAPHSRAAFTLIELLAVIAILTLLATFLLFALFGAIQQGKESRTKAEIAKLNEIIMAQYDTYQYRPLPIRLSGITPNAAQLKRLQAVRELMRLELPDRVTDVKVSSAANSAATALVTLSARPALAEAYYSQVKSKTWSTTNQSSECLYLILSQANDGFSPALDSFSESEFGDLDNDGVKEILDGWGRPIEFLRWAPAYTCAGLKPLQQNDATNQHDPFDTMKVDTNAYALYPVIVSGGLDKDVGIDLLPGSNTNPSNPFGLSGLGASTSGGKDVDNITNHYQEQR